MLFQNKKHLQSIDDLKKRIAQLEEELKKVTHNFSAALEQGKAVVYSRNFTSETYDFIGSGIKELTGYSAQEMTPAVFDSISITAEPQGELADIALDQAYLKNRTGAVNQWIADTKIRTKAGDIKYLLDMSTLLRDSSGRTYGTLGILMDITERKNVEQKLKQTTRELKHKNEEMELDLVTAREIQRALLTKYDKTFPANAVSSDPKLRFNDLYIPAKQLSGDFYYILPISEYCVGILIGDVMGHGIRASLITAYVRGLIEEIKPIAMENDRVMQILNNKLYSVLSTARISSFVTAAYMTIDVKNRILRYANAGHPHPIFVNKESGPIITPFALKREAEPACGLMHDYQYTVSSRPLFHNDVIYLYTDGVHDVKNDKEEFFGKERLASHIQEQYADPAETVLDTLLKTIKSFGNNKTEFDDDLCMVTCTCDFGQ